MSTSFLHECQYVLLRIKYSFWKHYITNAERWYSFLESHFVMNQLTVYRITVFLLLLICFLKIMIKWRKLTWMGM
jgi:hypothetical protein